MEVIKTYNEIYLAARRKLREHGIEAFDIEARLLAAAASGKTKEKFLQDSRLYVTGDEFENTLAAMVERRLKGEPVAYITGEWEFYGLPISVTPDTLIPRTDTELLADTAISLLRKMEKNTRCLDLCTGSGCIGLAIASNISSCRVILADKSLKALAVARQNMLKNNLSRMVTCVEGDVEQKPPLLLGRFDLVVCNPPYIPTKDIKELDESVKDYEPRMALDGGRDGLFFYRRVVENWSSVLLDGGWLAFEVGIGQAEAVAKIMEKHKFGNIMVRRDTGGIDRVVVGRKLG